MTDPTWSLLGELFHAALAVPADQRPAFLARRCGDDAGLRAEIEAMLAAHEGNERLQVEDRLLSDGSAALAEPWRGRVIGAYRLVELIGRGGMGDVYLAERHDQQYERRVAFKLIRPGLAGTGAGERFRRERQILARLEHPNMAMLLDGGVTEDGHPYLVMQYVDGEPITDWCRRRQLPLRRRLELLRTVCETVQAAHNNLVVHRDLKPANILVTDDGQVKLLDFGIAKLLEDDVLGQGQPGLTVNLDRLLTPAHAAPEQVTGQAVTTATDVYALGVLLYELLTDERPFAVDQSSAAALERSICETPPTPPSKRNTPHARRLRGELDNIVLKALRKEPQRRYQSARELAEDISRHLEGRPVQAQGDGPGYRLRKALARHRWAVTAAAVFLLTVSVSLVTISQESRRRLAQRDRALTEQRRADAVVGVLSDLLTRANPRNPSEGGVLTRDNFITMLDEEVNDLDEEPAVQARLRLLLADVHKAHGRHEDWLAAMEQVVRHHREAGADSLAMAALQHERALAVLAVRGPEEGVPLLRASLDRHLRWFGPDHRDVGIATQDLALALHEHEPDEAARLLERAYAIAQVSGVADTLALARALNGLGNLALVQGKLTDARDNYERSLNLLEPLLGANHLDVMVVTQNLCLCLRRPEELERAEELLRDNLQRLEQAVGRQTVLVARSWEALGVVLMLQGRAAEALAGFEEAAAIQREVSGPHATNTVNPLVKGCGALLRLGRLDEALERFALVRALDEARHAAGTPPDSLMEAFVHSWQALTRYEAGRRESALAQLEELAPWLDRPGPAGRAWAVAEIATVTATVLLAEGRAAAAEAPARLALAERLREQSHQPHLMARNRCLLAAALAGTGQRGEARRIFAEHGEDALACGYITPLQEVILKEARTDLGL